MKDVTKYVPLFAKPGVFNMELNNVLDNKYTGLFASGYLLNYRSRGAMLTAGHTAKVTATFYASSAKNPAAGKAHLIVPIGVVRDDTGAEVSVPPAFTKTVTLPKNTVSVYAELYASGNAQEEFWVLPLVYSYYSIRYSWAVCSISMLRMSSLATYRKALLMDGDPSARFACSWMARLVTSPNLRRCSGSVTIVSTSWPVSPTPT